jgi:putative CocE/NonD family hydrolase
VTVASRILRRLAHLDRAETEDVAVDRDLPMLAEAGVTLLADRWYPRTVPARELPVVLLRSPYGRRTLGPVARLMAERGYQVVIQSVRGTFGSGGTWEPFRNERADGRVTLAWLAEQSWWSGEMATWGASYLGLTQWAVAVDGPPALRAIAPNVTATRFRDIVVYPGGSFALETGATWLYLLDHQELPLHRIVVSQIRARRGLTPAYTTLPLSGAESAVVGHRIDAYQDWLVHERLGDEWWDPVDFGRDLSKVPPASLVGGWYDIFCPAQIDDFVALRHAGRPARLTIGPWTHTSPKGAGVALRDGLDWFDIHLRGRAGRARPHPVRLWIIGADRWADVPEWPPPAVTERWHLHPGGGLDRAAPVASEPDRWRYDPADPTPGTGGASLNAANAGPRNQRRREQRADVVCFTSAPLDRAVTFAGPLHAELWLRPSSAWTDVFVRLCIVDRRGVSRNLSDGILRLEPVPADGGPDGVRSTGSAEWGDATREADGCVRVRLRMWPTAVTFAPGQAIRLQVSSGAHPLFARNPGDGARLGVGERLVPVDVALLHDPAHPSGVDLPRSTI